MKSTFILLGLLTSLSSLASIPKYVICENDRGMMLEIELTPLEATFPIYDVKMTYNGRVFESLRASKLRDDFFLEGRSQDGETIYNLGFYRDNKSEVFFQQSANRGLSPLPGVIYGNCEVENLF